MENPISTEPRRHWYQFELGGLLMGVTLVAIGLAMLRSLVLSSANPDQDQFRNLCLWFMGPSFLGAGLLFPFRRPMIGCAIGCAIQVVVTAALFFYALNYLV